MLTEIRGYVSSIVKISFIAIFCRGSRHRWELAIKSLLGGWPKKKKEKEKRGSKKCVENGIFHSRLTRTHAIGEKSSQFRSMNDKRQFSKFAFLNFYCVLKSPCIIPLNFQTSTRWYIFHYLIQIREGKKSRFSSGELAKKSFIIIGMYLFSFPYSQVLHQFSSDLDMLSLNIPSFPLYSFSNFILVPCEKFQ